MLGLSYPNPLEPLHALNEVWTKPDRNNRKDTVKEFEDHRGCHISCWSKQA